jgi:hypothetical protein
MKFLIFDANTKIKVSLISVVLIVMSLCTLHAQLLGDVNDDNNITIIDGLLVAQYYVDLQPNPFNVNNADVNASNSINIIDALLIAQYYVGLITEFPGTTNTPVPTPVSTVPPATGPYDGYTFYGPMSGNTIYLVDMNGTIVHTWNCSNGCGYNQYLLEDGTILCSGDYWNSSIMGGGGTGRIQKIDWNGNILWDFLYSSSTYQLHHDLEIMPNGNVLAIAWEVKTAAETTAAGRSQAREIWPDTIIEVQPSGSNGGTIVWEWHAWDHLIQDYDSSKANYGVIADHPELLDVNSGENAGGWGGDWMHVNGISYNPELDQIVFSAHYLNELYVIDHGTTTWEAAGHTGGRYGKGGDILYRWGNPLNYNRGDASDQFFYTIHNAYWVAQGLPGAGNIIAFNNGNSGSGGYSSSIEEMTPPSDGNGNYTINPGIPYGPDQPVWRYSASGFFSNGQSGSQRLPNGNTLICETGGTIFEVTRNGQVVWEHTPQSSLVARALRYSVDYPGLSRLAQ